MAQPDSQMGKLDIGTDKHRSELISKKKVKWLPITEVTHLFITFIILHMNNLESSQCQNSYLYKQNNINWRAYRFFFLVLT